MSSDRVCLDRVARQHWPAPLHRHTQINMHLADDQAKGDISTLPARGAFLLCLDTFLLCLDRREKWHANSNVDWVHSVIAKSRFLLAETCSRRYVYARRCGFLLVAA